MAPGIVLSPSLFADRLPGSPLAGQDSSVVVQSEQEEASVQALGAAVLRLSSITGSGVELQNTDEEWERYAASDELPTPSWVSPVYRSELGPALVMDCHGEVPVAMADAFKQVLREELTRAGVLEAVVSGWPPGFSPGEPYREQ